MEVKMRNWKQKNSMEAKNARKECRARSKPENASMRKGIGSKEAQLE